MSSLFELSSEHIQRIPNRETLAALCDLLDDLRFIENSKPKKAGAEIIAAKRECSVSSLNHKLGQLKKDGPLALVDGRSLRKKSTSHTGHRSDGFVQWVHGLYFRCNRENATPEVQRQMLLRLRAWRDDPLNLDLKIPGYDAPPADSPRNSYKCPDGWSQRNLNKIKPDTYARALGGHGLHKAKEHLPPVLTTRVGLSVGEVYMFDDQHYDFKVAWKPGQYVRPVGINVLDLLSGCDVARGVRPFLKDNPEGEKSLKRDDIIWLAIDLLSFIGYNPARCQLVIEAGSSTFDQEFTQHIGYATDGVVTVSKGQVSQEEIGGLRVLAIGNPRFKAARESWFNILRNYTASMPLQIGQDRDHVPESTARIEQQERALAKLAQHLPANVQNQLQLEGVSWPKFVPLINHLSGEINRRTEHNLEGWHALGFEYTEFLVGTEWVHESEFLALPTETRSLVAHRMHQGELVTRDAKLSPEQVFAPAQANLKRVSPFLWPKLIPQRLAIPRKIPANRTVKIERKEYGPAPLIFRPHYYDENRSQIPLTPGMDVLIFISPLRPEFAIFTRTDASVLGVVPLVEAGTRFDDDHLAFQWGERGTLRATVATTATTHHDTLAREREKRLEDNHKLLADHGVKVPEKKKKTSKKSAGNIEILPPETLPESEPQTDPENHTESGPENVLDSII